MTGLEVWNVLKKYLDMQHHTFVKDDIPLLTVEGMPLDDIEKSLKALEIIKEKNVNVYWFKGELLLRNISYKYYVKNFGSFHNGLIVELLGEEEFDLLKEVLG